MGSNGYVVPPDPGELDPTRPLKIVRLNQAHTVAIATPGGVMLSMTLANGEQYVIEWPRHVWESIVAQSHGVAAPAGG